MNKNILTSCEVNSENASISFDGSILAQAGIDVKTLNSKISFTIHIINNYNEEYVSNVKIDNDLTSNEGEEGIYSGYLMKIINPTQNEYNFVRISD